MRNYSNSNVRIGISTLPKSLNAGNGLFLKTEIRKGDVVTYYDYDLVVDDEALKEMKVKNDPQYSYVLTRRKNEHLCGLMQSKRGRGMGSLINSGGGYFKNNCKFVGLRANHLIIIRAKKDLKKDDELFIAYNRGRI